MPVQLNLKDAHVDADTFSADEPARLMACHLCTDTIVGTRFDCIHCQPRKSVCLKCITKILAGPKKKVNKTVDLRAAVAAGGVTVDHISQERSPSI